MRVYRSLDDGALYLPEHVDEPEDTEHFEAYEIPEFMALSHKEVACGVNDVMEVLLKAGVARKVEG